MALKAGSVPSMPDLACVGLVKKVGEAYLSEKGVYHVLPLEVKANYGGRDGMFFFLFQPRWFEQGFDPQDLLREEKAGKLYGVYRRQIADEARPSVLQAIMGEEFDKLAEAFDDAPEATPEVIEEILREFLTGREVGYIMTQRKDEDGALTEQYNIQRFFPLDEETIKAVVEQSQNPKRRTPLVVTWDE